MIQVGDRVAYFIGPHRGAGTVEKLWLPANVAAVRRDDGSLAYPLVRECVPIEDAPEGVVGAVRDDGPLLLVSEPTELGEVDLADAVVGAAISACETIVRICDAAERLTLCERIELNGVIWLVQVAPETPGGVPPSESGVEPNGRSPSRCSTRRRALNKE